MTKNTTNSPENFDSLSKETRQRFARLQERLPGLYPSFYDRTATRTVVIVPSASVNFEVLAKIKGAHHYEERFLCLLILLRMPRVHIVFVTSQPIQETIIDYYLYLLPGVPASHARKRLTLLSCYDTSPVPLTQKILERPRLVDRIRSAVVNPDLSHITCFNATDLERALAVELDLPLYASDPDFVHFGSKSDGREVFRAAGVDLADGMEHIRDEQSLFEAVAMLKKRNPDTRRAVIKLNEAFSGEGNAIFDYPTGIVQLPLQELVAHIAAILPQKIRFEAVGEQWNSYLDKFVEMGGIAECWIDGEEKRSPSVQCRITPTGQTEIVSTHDQVLGGPTGQLYLGCSFPADADYRLSIQEAGLKIANVLKEKGIIGIWAVDFVSVKQWEEWKHYAIEINLRKGGTTFPYLTLEFLTDGRFDPDSGLFKLQSGQPRYYYASDNLQSIEYKGLTPDDLIDTMVYHQLHYDQAGHQGVVFHLMGALSEFGKVGVTCIGDSPEAAKELYKRAAAVLGQDLPQ